MGLEQAYKTIDIIPDGYPFRPGTAPSTDWVSVSKVDFQKDFLAGPPAKLPEIVRLDEGRMNNPHGKHVYHIWKIDTKAVPVCDVRSKKDELIPAFTPPTTEFRHSFATKCSPRPEHIFSKASPRAVDAAVGIVPGTELVPEGEERMLPSCRRDNTTKMSTKPFLQYTGKKRKHGQPFRDGGVFYNDRASDPVAGGKQGESYWLSVSSLTGQQFSRRRPVLGPSNHLPVVGFDGGPPSMVRSAGVRCGYSRQYTTFTRISTKPIKQTT